jgi:hypothetical protein
LSINLSANTSSPATATADAQDPVSTEARSPSAEESAALDPVDQVRVNPTEATAVTSTDTQETHLRPTENSFSENNAPAPPADGQEEILRTENALRDADEVLKLIDVSETLKFAIEKIKNVVDALDPVTEVSTLHFLPTNVA